MDLRQKAAYREKRFHCGDYLDVYCYTIYQGTAPAGRRGKRGKPTTEARKAQNRHQATERLTRLLNRNFDETGVFLTLTYRENPETLERVQKDVQNFFRRLKRKRDKLGLGALKYLYVIECSSTGRWHIHLVMDGDMDRDAVEKAWGKGYANSRRLQFGPQGLAGLAKYMMKSPKTFRGWSRSKNLIDPEPEVRDSRIRSRRKALALSEGRDEDWAREYPGYRLAEIGRFYQDEENGVYLFARLYREDAGFIKKKGRGKQDEHGQTIQHPRI